MHTYTCTLLRTYIHGYRRVLIWPFTLQSVGGLAAQIVRLLQGKHRVDFTPRTAAGDSVIIVNAIHVKMAGHSWDTKVYKFDRKSELAKVMRCLLTCYVSCVHIPLNATRNEGSTFKSTSFPWSIQDSFPLSVCRIIDILNT